MEIALSKVGSGDLWHQITVEAGQSWKDDLVEQLRSLLPTCDVIISRREPQYVKIFDGMYHAGSASGLSCLCDL